MKARLSHDHGGGDCRPRVCRGRRQCREQMGRRRRPADEPARLRRERRGSAGGGQALRRRPADQSARQGGQGDHPRRRAEADRHRLFQRHVQRHAGRGQGARQCQGDDRRADRSQDRRADQVHRQLHHPRRRRHTVRRQRSGRDRAGPEEGAVEGHPRRRLRRQLDSRRARMVRQPGRVQRHRQGDDGLDGQGDRRGRKLRHRHLDLHHAEPGALDRRNGGLRRQVPSEDEMARDGRGAGGQQPVVQPGDDAHQQVRRQAQGPVRHDVGRDAGFRRSGDQGRLVRQGRGRRPRDAERDEALCQRRLRQVGGVVEPDRSRLCGDLRHARGRRRQAEARRDLGRSGQARQAQRRQRQRNPARTALHLQQGRTSTSSTSET